jgi:queuosine precursor transporter
MGLIAVFLLAIVGANLTIATFGPVAVIPVAFTFVALDLVARDGLHELWKGRNLVPKMGLLIAVGGALSAALNVDAVRIALASCLAFTAAQTINALGYWALDRWPRLVKINASNVPAALVDSAVFLTVAFGSFMPALIAGQTVAKVAGGVVWSILLVTVQRRRLAGSSMETAVPLGAALD